MCYWDGTRRYVHLQETSSFDKILMGLLFVVDRVGGDWVYCAGYD